MIKYGDAFQLIKEIPDESIDLVITSPPYFQQRLYTQSDKEIGREKDIKSYLDKLLIMFKECLRVLKLTGSIVWNMGDKYLQGNLQLIPYQFALEANKLCTLVNNTSWQKENPTPRQFLRRLVPAHEPFFHFVKSNSYFFHIEEEPTFPERTYSGTKYFELIDKHLTENEKPKAIEELKKVIGEYNGGKIQSFRMNIRGVHALPYGGNAGGRLTEITKNGFTIVRLKGRKIKKDVLECPCESIPGRKHPAIFPVKIVEFFLELLTKENNVVLDPFIGSGTTERACNILKRQCIGFELCEDFQ